MSILSWLRRKNQPAATFHTTTLAPDAAAAALSPGLVILPGMSSDELAALWRRAETETDKAWDEHEALIFDAEATPEIFALAFQQWEDLHNFTGRVYAAYSAALDAESGRYQEAA